MANINRCLTVRTALAATAASFVFTAAAHAQTAAAQGQPIPRSQIGRDVQGAGAPIVGSYIRPRVGLQGMVTDNVYLTPTDHTSDFVTTVIAGAQAAYAGPRLDAMLDLTASYDSYARAHQLNALSVSGFGTAGYQVIPRFLSLEADGSVTRANTSTFGSTAFPRSGAAGDTVVMDFSAGPRITTTIGDLLDVDARTRIGWVGYDEAEGSFTPSVPQDATLWTADALATTGERYQSHEISVLLRYAEDDNDFNLYSGIASAYGRVSDNLRLLARGGYDEIKQGSQVNITSPLWSVGFEYEFNPSATFRFEAGRRYHDTSFASEALVEMTDQLYLLARYDERILPPQLAVNEDFLTFISNSRELPAPLRAQTFNLAGGLEDETSKEKLGAITLGYTWLTQSVNVGATWLARRRLVSDTREEEVRFNVGYERRLRPDLSGYVNFEYGRTLDDIGDGNSRLFRGSARLIFRFTPTVEIAGGYAYSNDRQTGVGGTRIIENAAFASITKSF